MWGCRLQCCVTSQCVIVCGCDRWRQSWVALWSAATSASGLCWQSLSAWWCRCRLVSVSARKVRWSTSPPAVATSSPTSSPSTATMKPRNERSAFHTFTFVCTKEGMVKGVYCSSLEPISELRSVACHMGSHRWTLNKLCLNHSQTGRYSIFPRWSNKAELTWLIGYMPRVLNCLHYRQSSNWTRHSLATLFIKTNALTTALGPTAPFDEDVWAIFGVMIETEKYFCWYEWSFVCCTDPFSRIGSRRWSGIWCSNRRCSLQPWRSLYIIHSVIISPTNSVKPLEMQSLSKAAYFRRS